MKIDVKNGDLTLVESDSVLVYEDKPIILTFDDQYKLSFLFSEDSTIKEYKINANPLTGGVEFNLINFNNPLGIAIGKPILFANADDKMIYVSVAVYSVGKAKVLHYNIYMGSEGENNG